MSRSGTDAATFVTRVRFAETDAMRVAHHGAYAAWLEAARVEWLRAIGLSYRELEDGGLSMAVADLQVHYRAALRFDDLAQVHCCLVELRSRRVAFHYQVLGPGDQLAAAASTVHVPTDRSGKAVRMPGPWFAALEPHLVRGDAYPAGNVPAR